MFHYSVWPPSSNYKSENIIRISPFLWHTGNPVLKSHSSYDVGVNYTFISSNRISFTVFANSWFVGNRSAFVYDATSQGVIRTIQQPIGSFSHYNYGINVSTKHLDGRLSLSGKIAQLFVHNGAPYNVNHSHIGYYLQALYYCGNFNFIIQAGWSNMSWNIRLTARNLQRWNWRSSYDTMHSDSYSVSKWVCNTSSHAYVQLSATYTFGFGRQIKQGNDISRQAGASSGILE